MRVYAFDRDNTVSTGEPPGPVPLAVVVKLKRDGHEVWSCGNTKLVEEAGIPGYEDRRIALPHKERRAMLKRLAELFPDAERIVIDDIDLSDVPGWKHYFPQQFMDAREKGTV